MVGAREALDRARSEKSTSEVPVPSETAVRSADVEGDWHTLALRLVGRSMLERALARLSQQARQRSGESRHK
jgi:hypothetical protein